GAGDVVGAGAGDVVERMGVGVGLKGVFVRRGQRCERDRCCSGLSQAAICPAAYAGAEYEAGRVSLALAWPAASGTASAALATVAPRAKIDLLNVI
ncbi:MAG: hypothetical protein KDB39_03375, partial [Austwickia sp.]|nr:hypothetical protein [Austwickia sp.]